MAFIPHSQTDIAAMLKTLGVKSVNDLFDEIPKDLRTDGLSHNIVPAAINEMEATREFKAIAKRDEIHLNFIGAGSYEHHIPAAVWDIVSRGEILTAYTPYQAEASQGTLQIIYEYQTMMASLMGLDCSNASMYDGASALAEAVLMAVRCQRHTKSKKILMPATVHPFYRETVKSIVNQGIEIIELPYCTETGATSNESLNQYNSEEIAALVIAQPNFFGRLEDVDALTNWAHQHNILVIACVNPLAMALLKEPGKWGQHGADIACGSGQPFGVPMASGGPYFGLLCCKQEFIRQMPGRIVGRTVDTKGRQGFALTLQAREQHIRRSKATSNICTNQGLLMTAATIYMSLLGPEGLNQVASASHTNTKKLLTKLSRIKGITPLFTQPYFHEVVIQLNTNVDTLIHALAHEGIDAGFSLKKYYPELGESLLVCVTETKTDADLDLFVERLESAMSLRESAKTPRRQDAKI